MRSAVILAKQKGEEEGARLQLNDSAKTLSKATEPDQAESPDVPKKQHRSIRVETEGAVYEDGKVYLKGNPLKTTKDILCPNCYLPRLLHPLSGVGARPPPDPDREYCRKHPPIIMPGHDVHGNPFATYKANRKTKLHQTQSTTTASSSQSTRSTPAAASFKQMTSEKVSFPTVKCPNCPRYFVITRVARHLSRCMGISSRQAKETSTSGSKPPRSKRARPKGDNEVANPTKKKKPNTPKKLPGKKPAPPSKLKNGTTPDMEALASSDRSKAGLGGKVSQKTHRYLVFRQ